MTKHRSGEPVTQSGSGVSRQGCETPEIQVHSLGSKKG